MFLSKKKETNKQTNKQTNQQRKKENRQPIKMTLVTVCSISDFGVETRMWHF